MKSRSVVQNRIKIKAGTNPQNDTGDFREWQRDCLQKTDTHKRVVVLAPTGSGKTAVAKARGAICLSREPGLKHLVSVPQNVIAASFTREALEENIPKAEWPGIGPLSWCADPEDINGIQKVDRLYGFITKTATARTARLMICSHQALVLVFQRLREEKKLAALKNIMLTISLIEACKMYDYRYKKPSLMRRFANRFVEIIQNAILAVLAVIIPSTVSIIVMAILAKPIQFLWNSCVFTTWPIAGQITYWNTFGILILFWLVNRFK